MSSRNHPLFRTLRTLRDHRRPFERLARNLVRDLLKQHVADAKGPIVEIGTGDGQLLDWLPDDVVGRMFHTEVVASAARDLAQRRPHAAIGMASAEALPVADATAAAVIGLCVLDVVPDGGAVAREVARVLRSGGHFIHVLDMTTHLGGWFRELVQGGVVPLPNVFFDPSAAHWPEDLFLAPAAQLRQIVGLLTAANHPLAAPLRQYVTLFETDPFPEERALSEFARISADADLRPALRHIFQTAMKLADPALRAELASYQGCVLSSSRYFERRLRQWFSPESGFEVVESDVVNTSERTQLSKNRPFTYESLCVGERRTLPALPEVPRQPRSPSEALDDPRPNQLIRELGVFVFVARRI
jgi:SAM-dependent methyltransferase